MSFQRGDIVQVVYEKSRYFGQVGAVESACDCFTSAINIALTGNAVYSVRIDGGKCFLGQHLKKIDGRPADATDAPEIKEREAA
jgi:hypothetical protein